MTWGGVFKYSSIKETKGFTLIELLAVIVVLAIISLIAVPIVLNIIENARKDATVSSARSYIKAAETYVVSSELDKTKLHLDKSNKYNVTKDTEINGRNYLKINDLVEIKGSKPTGSEDYIVLDDKYQVIEAKLTINGYEILIKNDEVITIIKGAKIDVDSISLNKTKETMEKGSSFKLEAIFNPSNASDKRVKYTSSNEDIVTVNDEGVVIAKEVGNAKIIVTSIDNTSKKAECDIEVVVSATGLKIEPTETDILVGDTVTLIGTIEPNNVTTSALEWSTSDINIASVDENGVVTGIGKGEAIITATTVNGIKATSKIIVNEIEAESISLDNASGSVEIGKTFQLTATVLPDNASNKTVTWTSSDDTVATIDSTGLVTGIKEGDVTITATTSNGKTATVSINVYKAELLSEKVSVGDYVAYDVSPNSVVCGYSTTLKGWRVLSKSGNTVSIVHAGQPACYPHGSGSSDAHIKILNEGAQSYINKDYAESAHAMNYSEADAISSSNSLRKTGAYYWLASPLNSYWLRYVNGAGNFGTNTGVSTYGYRPVVVLKAGIKTAGKTTDAVGQEAWSLVAQ